jgi:uridylate kinase
VKTRPGRTPSEDSNHAELAVTDTEDRPLITPKGPYKRVLLKVSGEALMGDQPYGIDMTTADRIAREVGEAVEAGYELCLVIGGGNIFRGLTAAAKGMERAAADYMGMLATVMNALAMQTALERVGVQTRVQSAIPMTTVCEPYIRRRAVRHMEKWPRGDLRRRHGQSVFHHRYRRRPARRRNGLRRLFKGTGVDGVYDDDPRKNPHAKRFESLDYIDVLARDLKVMDASAVTLMRDNQIPIVVFNIREQGRLARVLDGEGTCTVVGGSST